MTAPRLTTAPTEADVAAPSVEPLRNDVNPIAAHVAGSLCRMVPDDDGEESDGSISAANEWEMVGRTDGNKTRLEVLPAGYNFPVPGMPDAAI